MPLERWEQLQRPDYGNNSKAKIAAEPGEQALTIMEERLSDMSADMTAERFVER